MIVNYNVCAFLEQALRTVDAASKGLAVEVFVVDNASVDGSLDMVRATFPHVQVIANADNVGFSTANNQAIRLAQGRYVLLLNPDTLLREDTLTTLVRFLDDHPEAGAAGCRILNPDGSFAPESRRSFPTPEVAFYRITGLSKLFPKSERFGRYNLTYLPVDEETEIDALSGSFMCVRRRALYEAGPRAATDEPGGAGLLDEAFFMYGEDLDWCYRIQQAGWAIWYTPETELIHYKGESTKKGELRYVRLFYGAMLLFAEKHFRGRYSGLFRIALRGSIVLRGGLMLTRQFVSRAWPSLFDAALTGAIIASVGLVRSEAAGATVAERFWLVVLPAAAALVVAGIGLGGGYRRARRGWLGPVVLGVTGAFVTLAAASFFVKAIGFSRLILGVSAVASLVALAAWRLVWRSRQRQGERKAVLVGSAEETARLHAMLVDHPAPPFALIGFVSPPDDEPTLPRPLPFQTDTQTVPLVGRADQLRDIVRLRDLDDVIFAAEDCSAGVVLAAAQHLGDLGTNVRVFSPNAAGGSAHVIGKASIDALGAPPVHEAERVLPRGRSRATRRALEVLVALAGLATWPFVGLAAALGHGKARRARVRWEAFPRVLTGRLALIGFRPADHPPAVSHRDEPRPRPAPFGVPPAAFDVAESLPSDQRTASDRRRALAFYREHQSAALDLQILTRALRDL